jgi:adenylate kinase family enzyme
MQPQTFVFFGIVGSGKGTQVKLLMDFLKKKEGVESVYAGTGEGFRQLVTSDSYTGTLVKESMESGVLIADFLTNAIFTNILISSLTQEKNLIADGYPRTVAQSEVFDEMMKFFKRGSIKIIYIELSKEEAMKRNLLRGRMDDTRESIEQRFDEYLNKVMPAMDYFKDKENYQIYDINGDQSVENVHKDIINVLRLSDSLGAKSSGQISDSLRTQ